MRGRVICAVAALAALTPSVSVADALDGEWCARTGRSLYIDGPAIVTPGGNRIEGDYRRHRFTYKAPAGDRDAGKTVHLQQLDDDTMHLTRGGEPGATAPEVWRRCAGKIS